MDMVRYYDRALAEEVAGLWATTDGDEIFVVDEDTGVTYVFRGARMYEVIDGREVLCEEGHKDPSDRPRE